MIILPLSAEPPAPLSGKQQEADQAVVHVLVLGFTPAERKLLDGVISLARRRTPAVRLLTHAAIDEADVIILDAQDSTVMAWTALQTGLEDKAVIWVDAKSAPAGHTLLRRPVQWPMLPMLLHQALEKGPAGPLHSVEPATH